MSQKRKHHHTMVGTVEALRPRVDRAVSEGRFQQALDLAKQLYKHEPTAEHLELLKKCYLGRARQLHSVGYDRDAATTLEAAIRIDASNPAWLEKVANELAVCGAAARAMELLKQVPSAGLGSAVLASAVDTALQREAGGKAQLPAELHADFEHILLAFQQVEARQDESAKETLQSVGLKSPFLDWKLLIRGLAAYYQNDDARAIENWARLNPERVPARLAAPFRCHIDRTFREAQPAATQNLLESQLQRLQGSTLAQQLRDLQTALADTKSRTLARAFRLAETLVPHLQQEAPQLVPRLARCCYWTILETGPDDALRFKRVFGALPEDPNFHRIEALAQEHAGIPEDAQKSWRDYEKEIAANPAIWPPAIANRARALIWLRMGRNAASVPDARARKNIPRGLREVMELPPPLKPGAKECLRHSIELAPDLLEPYEELYRFHERAGQTAEAEAAALNLLERFPDHVSTLTQLGEHFHREERYPEALALFQRALTINPLQRQLRSHVSIAHVGCARLMIADKRVDEGRVHLQSALTFNDDPDDSIIRCRWAALEFAAGNPESADVQLAEARAHAGANFPVSYRMLTECVRMKLDRKLKSRFDKEVKAGFTEPAIPAAVAGVVACASSLKGAGIIYYGQKTHEKKVTTYADKALRLDFSERQMVAIAEGLFDLGAPKVAQKYVHAGERKFKKNPEFPVLLADMLLKGDPGRRLPFFEVANALDRAEKLVNVLPKEDERKERLIQKIVELKKMKEALDPFTSMFGFGGFTGFPDFGDDFDDEEDDDDEGSDDW